MPVVIDNSLPSEEKVRKELKIMRAGTDELLKSKETARQFLHKHGFITRTGKLTKRYGG